jgi:hypothetical protein
MDRADGRVQMLLVITVIDGWEEALVLRKGNVDRLSIIVF